MAEYIGLVIKITEEKLSIIKNKMYCGIYDPDLYKAIENGIVLPKGHGRLIDVNELKKIIKENDGFIMSGFSVRLCDIDNTPTIIEADKAESEDT